jgi:beta-lactam-binding protein with PASTA domain
MSDFLSQFQTDKYKKIEEKKDTTIETKRQKEERIYEKEPKKSGIKQTDHDTEIDTRYHKRKIIMYVTIALTIICVFVISFFIIRYLNQVAVKNFVGTSISEARTWGLKNKIELDIEEVFDKQYSKEVIIWQDQEPNSKMQKGSILYLKVSKGADPDERIELPDFTTMNYSQIRDWIKENKVENANIIQEYNEEIESTRFIRKELKEGIQESNYTRKDSLTIYISKGSQKQDKNITVPDFTGKPKADIDSWAKEKSVNIVYKQSGSETVPEGSAISQSIAAGSRIAIQDTIEVTISIGKGITVPNFANISREEASSAGMGLNLAIKTRYSQTVPYGKLISQSVKSGTRLYGDNRNVEVVYSEGKPYIGNLVGRTEKEIEEYAYDLSTKGVTMTYEFKYVDSEAPKGTVVWSSKANEYIDMKQHIVLNISKGNLESNTVIPGGNTIIDDDIKI